MGNPELKDLFFKTRFVGGWHLLAVALYMPVGVVLALIRVFVSLQAYLLALLLLIPELSFIRGFVLRVIGLVLGIFIIEENPSQRDKNVRVLVANHITILDHIPVHLLTGCFSPSRWEVWPLCLKVFEGSQDKHMFATSLRSHLSKTPCPLLLQPEEADTNGRVGLLKFAPWCAGVAAAVQPVCLIAWRPLAVTPTTLGATFSLDLFWFLFSPITIFRIRYLPVIQKQEGDTDEEMADRVAQSIAKELGLVYTKFTAKDKAEYEKRQLLEASHSASSRPRSSPRLSYELQRMAAQVSEVLPYVPPDVIVRDLCRTRSVDLTISNILEGAVRYTPLPQPHEHRASTSSVSRPTSSTSMSSEVSGPFPRSAQDRMMSFVERKARLIEDARRRYMEKHGLLDKQ